MKGCEDFLTIVLHAHVVAAAKEILAEESIDNAKDLSKEILKRFVSFDPNEKISRADKVYLYASQLMTFLLLWHAFNDAVREGDGDRVISYWKFLLVIFRVKGHRNYCKEAIILLSQYNFLLSPRKAAQLKWCRFINTKGRIGRNISCDLHLEHLNRRLKGLITGIGSNASKSASDSIYPNNAVNRAARSIGVLHDICCTFEEQNAVTPESDKHIPPSFTKDVKSILEVLQEQKVFEQQTHRKHASFSNFNTILQQCPSSHLKPWIKDKIKTYGLQ